MRATLLALATAVALTVPAGAGAASCTNLKVSSATKSAILESYNGRGTFVRNSLYYGRCGSTYYAAASFRSPGAGLTDQPESFKKSGSRWRDLGDGGCDPSNRDIPSSLKKIWKLCVD